MLYPSIFGENLFDDFFRFPDFGRDVEKKLYGKHAAQVMKTDVHEHDDHYEIVIDDRYRFAGLQERPDQS